MGKLLNFLKSSTTPAAAQVPAPRQEWRYVQGTPVDIEIVGESFHQDYIRSLAKRVGDVDVQIVLRPEPNNPYDRNAVAVHVDGRIVGHLSKAMAAVWQPMVLAAESEGYLVAGVAQIYGGTPGKPSLGVFGSAPWPGRDVPPGRWG